MLPSGEMTYDEDAYANAWIELGSKVEELFTGYKATSFNPDIEFVTHNPNPYCARFVLSVDQINNLLNNVEQLKTLNAELSMKNKNKKLWVVNSFNNETGWGIIEDGENSQFAFHSTSYHPRSQMKFPTDGEIVEATFLPDGTLLAIHEHS